MNIDKNKVAAMPLLVTAAVVVDNDKVLLTKRPDNKRHPGMWEFPGGKVEPGESPGDALRRELQEELGIDSQIDGIYEVVFYRYDWGAVLILAYSCTLLGGPLQNLGVAEHRWVERQHLPDFDILPADRPIIERLTL